MRNKRILVLEDEVPIALNIEQALEEGGYDTVITHSFRKAKEEIDNMNVPFDLAIIDIHLDGKSSKKGRKSDTLGRPNGIDIAHMLSKDLGIPVIFYTGYDTKRGQEIVDKALSLNPENYVVKKEGLMEDLVIKVKLALARSRRLKNVSNLINIKDRGVIYRMNMDDIFFLKADDVNCYIATKSKVFCIVKNLKTMCKLINHVHLIRVHKSYAINYNKINALQDNELLILRTQHPKVNDNLWKQFSKIASRVNIVSNVPNEIRIPVGRQEISSVKEMLDL